MCWQHSHSLVTFKKITFNDKKPVNTAALKLLQLEHAPLKAKFRSKRCPSFLRHIQQSWLHSMWTAPNILYDASPYFNSAHKWGFGHDRHLGLSTRVVTKKYDPGKREHPTHKGLAASSVSKHKVLLTADRESPGVLLQFLNNRTDRTEEV